MSQPLGGGWSIPPTWSVTSIYTHDSAFSFNRSIDFTHYSPDQAAPTSAEEFAENLSAAADAGNSNFYNVFGIVPFRSGSYLSSFTHAGHEMVGSVPSVLNVGESVGSSSCCQTGDDEGSGILLGLTYGAELTQGTVNSRTTINGSQMSMGVFGSGAQGSVTAGVIYHKASGDSNGINDETNYTQNVMVDGDYVINYSVNFMGSGACSLCSW